MLMTLVYGLLLGVTVNVAITKTPISTAVILSVLSDTAMVPVILNRQLYELFVHHSGVADWHPAIVYHLSGRRSSSSSNPSSNRCKGSCKSLGGRFC